MAKKEKETKERTIDLIGWKTIDVINSNGDPMNGLVATWDDVGKRWIVLIEDYQRYTLKEKNESKKEQAKQTRKANRERAKLEREERKRQREEKLKNNKFYQEQLRIQQEKERKHQEKVAKKQAKKQAKKDQKEQEKEYKKERTWNHWFCDKYHTHVKTAVNQYYTLYKNVINDDAWFAGRGEEVLKEAWAPKDDVKDPETGDTNIIDGGHESGPTIYEKVYVPLDVELKPYENDYVATLGKNDKGFTIIISDNWDNCWHRDRWEYILLHKNGPGKSNDGTTLSKEDLQNDPIYKVPLTDNLDLDTQAALFSLQKDFNDDFLMGNETNDVFKSDAELQDEREYNTAMTTASQLWESSNQTKRTETSNTDIWLYDSYTGVFYKAPELKGLIKKNIYNDGNSVQDNLKQAAAGINSSLNMINEVITPKLVTYVTTYMTDVLMTYTQRCVVQMLSFDASEIVSMATKLSQDYIKTPGTIMKELLASTEDLSSIELDLKQNDMLAKFNGIIGNHAATISQFTMKQLEKCNNEIAAVAYYTQMGPAWLNDKVDKVINESLKFSLGYIGKARDFVVKEKNKFVYNISNELSKKIALETNKKLEETTKAKLDEIEINKQMALTKAKTMIIEAKCKLLALIGG